MSSTPTRIGFIVGEASGDLLGGAIARAIRAARPDASFFGVGGPSLREQGLSSWFDPSEIAIVGVTEVLRKLPRLVRLIEATARNVIDAELDALVLIDAPDFTHRVARKVRARRPGLPIVKVVAPTVWAWRPERAAQLRPLVDEVLALFPFEPEVMTRLGGPPTTFIGHPLLDQAELNMQAERDNERAREIVVLPGSRRSEIERLAGPFGETLAVLRDRSGPISCVVPTLPDRAELVQHHVSKWSVAARVVVGDAERYAAFARARAGLAASGTVTLELALAGVPSVVAYKLDALERHVAKRITTWAIAMPNLVADRLIMPELLNEMVRPDRIARLLERLLEDTPERAAQCEGFALVRKRLSATRPAAETAAARILQHLEPDQPRFATGT